MEQIDDGGHLIPRRVVPRTGFGRAAAGPLLASDLATVGAPTHAPRVAAAGPCHWGRGARSGDSA